MKMQTYYINHPTLLEDIAQSIRVFEEMHGFWREIADKGQYAHVAMAGHLRYSDTMRQIKAREPVEEGCSIIDTEVSEGWNAFSLSSWCMVFKLQLWDAYCTYLNMAAEEQDTARAKHYANLAHFCMDSRLQIERNEHYYEMLERDRLFHELHGESFSTLQARRKEEAAAELA